MAKVKPVTRRSHGNQPRVAHGQRPGLPVPAQPAMPGLRSNRNSLSPHVEHQRAAARLILSTSRILRKYGSTRAGEAPERLSPGGVAGNRAAGKGRRGSRSTA
jgi:hypothetical protein